jgi:hypothetical protein
MLKEFNMVPYVGQNNGKCNVLILYEFEGKDFYSYSCCLCSDIPNPMDCNMVSYTIKEGKYYEERWNKFMTEAKNKGIVGIEE